MNRRQLLLGGVATLVASALPKVVAAAGVWERELEGLTVDFRAANGPRYTLSFFVRRGLEGVWERVTVPAKMNLDGSISLSQALGYVGEGDAMIIDGAILETSWLKFDGEDDA